MLDGALAFITAPLKSTSADNCFKSSFSFSTNCEDSVRLHSKKFSVSAVLVHRLLCAFLVHRLLGTAS